MSRESLEEILNKLAQVTAILVETSKIKEQLDKCDANANLEKIIGETKSQVDDLLEHATFIKELYDKNLSEKPQFNGNDGSTESDSGLTNGSSDKTPQAKKPIIKLVDISKLVEPKALVKKEVPQKSSVKFDDTVVLITSSDEEPQKTTCEKPIGKRKAAQETIKKTRKALQVSSESSDEEITKTKSSRTGRFTSLERSKKSKKVSSGSSDEETVTKTKPSRNGRRKFADLSKVVLSGNDTSDSSVSIKIGPKDKQTKKKKESKEMKSVGDKDWKNDPKINSKCYVKVLRVPCEKLKEYYLEKLELMEIKKLSDLSSLNKKRRRTLSNSSSNSEKNDKRKKKKVADKNQEDKEETSGDETSSDITDDNVEKNSENKDVTEALNNEKSVEALAEDALNMLDSDKEEEETQELFATASEENLDKTGDKFDTAQEGSTSTEKGDNNDGETAKNPNTDNDGETAKDQPDVEKDKSTEEVPEESNAKEPDNSGEKETTNTDDAEKEDDTEKETSEKADSEEDKSDDKKKKKSWCKDKLLTAKISSSDSEEEFDKFRKKKDKIQEDSSSDDEPKIPKDKVKRITKKRLKKAIVSDSDSANEFQPQEDSSSSSDSEKENDKKEKEEEEKAKRARKRVKRVRDSSEEDDDEKSTRKQIRNIWGRDSLAETTKQAEAEEKERKARIAEKQKKYNQIYEFNEQKNAKVDKIVLDFDEENQKELLKVDDDLVAKLKPHQASGVQFMWDACFESLERTKKTKGSGCILAHCMGLGKTLQVITLSHTLLLNSEETNVRKVLVVSPLNTVLNWVHEFKQWLPDNDDYEIYELVSFKQNYERQYQVKTWHDNGGVLVIGYDMFRNLSNPDNKRLSKKMRTVFQEALVDPGPDLVICDEGHLLKNEKTNTSIAMNRIKTLRRVVLTGTPLQNNLKEYFCMVQFVKPNLLGTYKEYLNRFVNPIINGQYTDSTPHDIQVMRRRSHVLHKMLDGIVQRRDYSVLEPYLPPKHEYVLFLTLTEVQIKLYQHYMEHFAKRSSDGTNRTSFLFVDFQALQRICTHPRVLLDKSIEMKNARDKRDDSEEESEGSLKDFINDDDEEDSTSSSNSNSDGEDKPTVSRKRVTRATAALAKEDGDDSEVIAVEDSEEKEWWQQYCDGDELNNIAHSSKLFLLFEILKECEQIGDKVLVFSQSLYSLNVIEYFLGRIHDATQDGDTDSVCGFSGSWCLGLDYFRLDGSSSCDSRNTWCKNFNKPSNTRARLFLISTRAGGLGINLVAANRVIIFDVSWNPSHDIQSIYRVYRFGQTKPCYIYRFVTSGTMEMKIYERQVTKQAISKRVIDEQQIDRHYNQNDLAELYKFDPKPENRPIPLVPKDVLLGELLQKFEDRIYKYHEHQSLLENKEDEGLNEEERKAAWEEFENEKKQRNYLGNYMRIPNMDIALASLAQKLYPSWDEAQIKAVLPLLHQQLQEQVARGDFTLYKSLQQELQLLQAMQNQRYKEQLYQQQAIRLLQQQKQQELMMNYQNAAGTSFLNQYLNQLPGTSQTQPPRPLNPNEVIDLND